MRQGRNEKWDGLTQLGWQNIASNNHHMFLEQIQIQAYAPTSNTEKAEVEWFYEDLQHLLELTPPKDVLFIIRDWNAKDGGLMYGK